MFDVITFGSATLDVFLRSKKFKVIKERDFFNGRGLCLPFGSKVEIKDAYFSSGGGGTNTAATFARQGLRVAFCGMVGSDAGGEIIMRDLKEFRIRTDFVARTKSNPTDISVILNSDKEDRTILAFHGASTELTKKEVPWKGLRTRWFYLAPFSGKLTRLFEPLLDFAEKNKIRVAVNPGEDLLSLPKSFWKRVLRKIDILILNEEEASILTGTAYGKDKEVFQALDKLSPPTVIMTKGERGVVASDGEYIYGAPAIKTDVIAKTGAGDAFASGFLAGLIRSDNVKYSIQLGTANAAGVLKKVGAKAGLLKKNERFKKVKVEIKRIKK